MKIHYTAYRNHPEATSISKETSILSFFVIGLGFAFALIVAGEGGLNVLWGILIMGAAIAISVFISKNASKEIEEITDDVSQALKEAGITISRQVKFTPDSGITMIRIVIDEKDKIIYVLQLDKLFAINYESFISCTIRNQENIIGVVRKDYSELNNTYFIRANRASVPDSGKYPIIFEINYKQGFDNKQIKSFLYSPSYSTPQKAIAFSNEVIDLIKSTLEKEYGNHTNKDYKKVVRHSTSNEVDITQKYKTLLEEGLITQKEFDEKIKELVNK